MAKNGAKPVCRVSGCPTHDPDGPPVARHPVGDSREGLWVPRCEAVGRFGLTKRAGGNFKGVKRER